MEEPNSLDREVADVADVPDLNTDGAIMSRIKTTARTQNIFTIRLPIGERRR
jgi:hypothetical protein